MKTVVKIDPQREYDAAKEIIGSLSCLEEVGSDISKLDGSVDNLKTVINVLMERLTPKKRKDPKKRTRRRGKTNKLESDPAKLPSKKYPDLPIEENIIRAEAVPFCSCCQEPMTESGVYKTAEKLEVIPKQYHIVRNKRVVYNCSSCKEAMVNTPAVASISPTSNYGDSVIIDAALSKYCDLIPMERYSAMAEREGLSGLPANSLISLSHQLAQFLTPVYQLIMEDVLNAEVVLADETPHKMLEGDSTKNWFLWGFSSRHSCYFEAHGTRKGQVPLSFLRKSTAAYLVTDGYSGYKKALTELRREGRTIVEVHCNAHAFRYFEEASTTWQDECQPYLETYGKIYDLEREAETDQELATARHKMTPLFEQMKAHSTEDKQSAMPSSAFEKAINYFLNHFNGLTQCLSNITIPLDNNSSERLLRNPVIGRKTWYGTHSQRGAKTSSILFSIVETCKMNRVNPRAYFSWVTSQIHKKLAIKTPQEWAGEADSG